MSIFTTTAAAAATATAAATTTAATTTSTLLLLFNQSIFLFWRLQLWPGSRRSSKKNFWDCWIFLQARTPFPTNSVTPRRKYCRVQDHVSFELCNDGTNGTNDGSNKENNINCNNCNNIAIGCSSSVVALILHNFVHSHLSLTFVQRYLLA